MNNKFLQNRKHNYQILQETMINTTTEEWMRLQQQDHNKKSGLDIKIREGTLVGWRNSDNKFQSGVVTKIQGHQAIIKDKMGEKHTEFTGNLNLLVSINYDDFIKSQGRGIKNK